MSDTPVVLISVRDHVVSYDFRGNIEIVVIDWDVLEEASLGKLCRAYKTIWSLPEDMRQGPLTELIGLVQRRFPLVAAFHPQRLVNGREVAAGQPVKFDVTEKLLWRGPDYIDNLRDDDYPIDDLAEDLLARLHHDGPFMINVQAAAMEFLFADENEAGGPQG